MASSPFHYVVTSQPPTAITQAVAGSLISDDETTLVVAKSTRIEGYSFDGEELSPIFDEAVFGRIVALRLVRIPGETKDNLFFFTQDHQFGVLSYDVEAKRLVNVATGNAKDRIGRPAEYGPLVAVDPAGRLIALHMSEGLIKIIPTERGFGDMAYNRRLPDLVVLDMAMLHRDPSAPPTLAILTQSANGSRHVVTYSLPFPRGGEGELRPGSSTAAQRRIAGGPIGISNVGSTAQRILAVPQPLGGLLILTADSAKYVPVLEDGQRPKLISIKMPTMTVRAAEVLAGNPRMVLIGDNAGGLSLLGLQGPEAAGAGAGEEDVGEGGGGVTGLELTRLGQSSIASTLNYLDEGVLFLGSCFGDSKLLRLLDVQDPETKSMLSEMDSYDNIGPIVDMCFVDLEREGQGQVITCSGAYQDGSLRVVRSGIGIEEQAEVELPGIMGLWNLRATGVDAGDAYLVQAFAQETRALRVDEEGMEEQDVPGFVAGSKTLWCGNVHGGPGDTWDATADFLCQVTPSKVVLVEAGTGAAKSEWADAGGKAITVADGTATQVLVALQGGGVVLLHISPDGQLQEQARCSFDHDVACLSAQALGLKPRTAAPSAAADEAGEEAAARLEQPGRASLCAVGLWEDMTVHVLKLPSLEVAETTTVPGDAQARSLQLATLEVDEEGDEEGDAEMAVVPGRTHLLLAGLGDGGLVRWSVDAGSGKLSGGKKASIGTQPVTLRTFSVNGGMYVFAACDRPTVVHASNGKVLFSTVNHSDMVAVMAPFNGAPLLPDCLALASESGLVIGSVDDIRKLHFQKVPLDGQPRCIAHHASSGTLVVGLQSDRVTPAGDMQRTMQLQAFDAVTFEPSPDSAGGVFALRSEELVTAVRSVTLDVPASEATGGAATQELVAVGTSVAKAGEDIPSRGRVLLFSPVGGSAGEGAESSSARLVLRESVDVDGAANDVHAVEGRLVVAINSKVNVFRWGAASASASASAAAAGATAESGHGLHPECGYFGHCLSLYLDVRGPLIVVGDLMRSVAVLRYDKATATLETDSQDAAAAWTTAVGAASDSILLAGDNALNLVSLRRATEAASPAARARLEHVGQFHLGELVNRFVGGSLVMVPPEDVAGVAATAAAGAAGAAGEDEEGSVDVGPRPKMLFGTTSGSIGALITLPPRLFHFLRRLERAMQSKLSGLGNLSHKAWRTWSDDQQLLDADSERGSPGFIDGDLVERLLELPPTVVAKVVKALNDQTEEPDSTAHPSGRAVGPATVEEVLEAVEELALLH